MSKGICVAIGAKRMKIEALQEGREDAEKPFYILKLEGDFSSISDNSGRLSDIEGNVTIGIKIPNCLNVKGVVKDCNVSNMIYMTAGAETYKTPDDLIRSLEQRNAKRKEETDAFIKMCSVSR